MSTRQSYGWISVEADELRVRHPEAVAKIEAAVVKRAVDRLLVHNFLQGSVDDLLPWLLAPTDDHDLLPEIDRGIREITRRRA